jgi:hypothetical protein
MDWSTGDTAMLTGDENRAFVPNPSACPEAPEVEPAMVVTTPPGVTALMALLPVSAAYMMPDDATARPVRPLKRAAVPVPSAKPVVLPPAPPPATVLPPTTTIRAPSELAYTVPPLDTARPKGYETEPTEVVVSVPLAIFMTWLAF